MSQMKSEFKFSFPGNDLEPLDLSSDFQIIRPLKSVHCD